MTNQKGIAFIPILIWAAAILLTGTAAVKEGLIKVNLSGNGPLIQKVDVIPTPLPNPTSKPIPTQKPVVNQQPTQQVQQTANNDQIIKHDGSRSGPIVDYLELCTGKTIKVYENERVPYKIITGGTVYSTRGDIKCYEDQIKQLKESAQNNQPYTPSNSTYTAPSYPIYSPKPLVNCVVSYPCTGASYTYQVDQSTCSFMQSGAASTCSTSNAIKKMQEIVNQPIVVPTLPPVDYSIHVDPTPTCRMTPYGCFSN